MKVNKEIRRIELDKRKRIEKMRYVKVENLGKMLIYKINFPAYIYIFSRGNNLFEILRVEVCFSRNCKKRIYFITHVSIPRIMMKMEVECKLRKLCEIYSTCKFSSVARSAKSIWNIK